MKGREAELIEKGRVTGISDTHRNAADAPDAAVPTNCEGASYCVLDDAMETWRNGLGLKLT